MANDCLVTKFKGAVDNDNLPILGYEKYSFKMDEPGNGAGLCLAEAGKLILLDGVWTANGTREMELQANYKFFPNSDSVTPDNPSQEYCTILVPKYTCYRYLNVYPLAGETTVDLTGFKYLQDQSRQVLTQGAHIDLRKLFTYEGGTAQEHKYTIKGIEYVDLSEITLIEIPNIHLSESIDVTPLGSKGYLTHFTLGNVKECYGILDNLGKSNINWDNGVYFPDTKNVSIDLVNFVNNRRNAGATTGTITFRILGSITVKANGTVLDVPLQSNDVLVWDASSITLNGNPIS